MSLPSVLINFYFNKLCICSSNFVRTLSRKKSDQFLKKWRKTAETTKRWQLYKATHFQDRNNQIYVKFSLNSYFERNAFTSTACINMRLAKTVFSVIFTELFLRWTRMWWFFSIFLAKFSCNKFGQTVEFKQSVQE